MALLERTTWRRRAMTRQARLLIASQPTTQPARPFTQARGRGRIENRLHWGRDGTFGGDAGSLRSGATPRVLASLRGAGRTNLAAAQRHYAWQPGALWPSSASSRWNNQMTLRSRVVRGATGPEGDLPPPLRSIRFDRDAPGRAGSGDDAGVASRPDRRVRVGLLGRSGAPLRSDRRRRRRIVRAAGRQDSHHRRRRRKPDV